MCVGKESLGNLTIAHVCGSSVTAVSFCFIFFSFLLLKKMSLVGVKVLKMSIHPSFISVFA